MFFVSFRPQLTPSNSNLISITIKFNWNLTSYDGSKSVIDSISIFNWPQNDQIWLQNDLKRLQMTFYDFQSYLTKSWASGVPVISPWSWTKSVIFHLQSSLTRDIFNYKHWESKILKDLVREKWYSHSKISVKYC